MPANRKTFSGRVARRMFLVFSLCALVPILAFAVYSFSRVGAQLEADAAIALGAEAKSVGMSIYERFAIALTQLRVLSTTLSDPPKEGMAAGSAFLSWGATSLDASSMRAPTVSPNSSMVVDSKFARPSC